MIIRIFSAFVSVLLTASAAPAAPATKPNIIVILVDDMGFSDLGCYGSEIPTPNLDALAQGGVRFTQFYNTARCCPTRASLLTGLHPHQAGIGHMMEDRGFDGYRGSLNRQCVTIAEALQPALQAGTHTAVAHCAANGTPQPLRGFHSGISPSQKLSR